jgi:2-polyprenyl-3-methyl-5-hydroxy-6-metoxy-1,4-benzoquinol methylase
VPLVVDKISFATDRCPLCHDTESRCLQGFDRAKIVAQWQEVWGIDIRNELADSQGISLRECLKCCLQYFWPSNLAGSAELYEHLGKFDWYYISGKWEHDVALEDLKACKKGIEIGCGNGDFVARALKAGIADFSGIELNPDAVAKAKSSDLPVMAQDLAEVAQKSSGDYDVVCAFQVLEHLSNPGEFLRSACSLLRSGGKLLIGVPNADSFLRFQYNLLNMPPHHTTRWPMAVFTRITALFPLQLRRIVTEPLASYHVYDYAHTYLTKLSQKSLPMIAHPRMVSLATNLIQVSRANRWIKGETVYVCYSKE